MEALKLCVAFGADACQTTDANTGTGHFTASRNKAELKCQDTSQP